MTAETDARAHFLETTARLGGTHSGSDFRRWVRRESDEVLARLLRSSIPGVANIARMELDRRMR